MITRILTCVAAAALATAAAPASAASFIGDAVTIKRIQGSTTVKTVSGFVGVGAEYTDNFFNIDVTVNQVIFDAVSGFSIGGIVYEIAGLDFDDNPATPNVVQDFTFSQINGNAANPFGSGRLSFTPGGALKVDFSNTTGGSSGLATITFGAAPVGGVPEPATWAMMIGGFGLAGGTLRSARRRKGQLAYSL